MVTTSNVYLQYNAIDWSWVNKLGNPRVENRDQLAKFWDSNRKADG